ncbi:MULTISPECIES: hypothetical protein [unclassified Paraburkholderia]|uniref:hypothetical protein n=1 Tax=unclassified Paraburkholderia TaxID=2615204 RepID=UPI002AB60CFA|nr:MULTISPECIES: hypothetical protein [unclassified Paraburkholderia]
MNRRMRYLLLVRECIHDDAPSTPLENWRQANRKGMIDRFDRQRRREPPPALPGNGNQLRLFLHAHERRHGPKQLLREQRRFAHACTVDLEEN